MSARLKQLGRQAVRGTDAILDNTHFTVALFLLVVVPAASWTVYDRFFNYIEATVQVSKVEHVCYAVRRDGKPRREQLPVETCDALRTQARDSRGPNSLRLMASTYLSFEYVSPVDGNVHEGRIERKSDTAPNVNDEIQILISTIDPSLFRD